MPQASQSTAYFTKYGSQETLASGGHSFADGIRPSLGDAEKLEPSAAGNGNGTQGQTLWNWKPGNNGPVPYAAAKVLRT